MSDDWMHDRMNELIGAIDYSKSQLHHDMEWLHSVSGGSDAYDFAKDTVILRQNQLVKYIENLEYIEKLIVAKSK